MKYLFFLFMATCHLGVVRKPPCCGEVLSYAEERLPHCGVLRSGGGFVYVKVDDAYIHDLVTFLQQDGFIEPPYFEEFNGEPGVGAHISVIYPDEVKKYGVSEMAECGEVIPFTLEGCEELPPGKMVGIEKVYFIVVKAPKLDRIREKYGLPKREYDFHITVGVKPKEAKAG